MDLKPQVAVAKGALEQAVGEIEQELDDCRNHLDAAELAAQAGDFVTVVRELTAASDSEYDALGHCECTGPILDTFLAEHVPAGQDMCNDPDCPICREAEPTRTLLGHTRS